jgi:hypothetical protein
MSSRDNLTKVFLKQWGVSTDEANVKFFSRQWWVDPRANNNSLRLTKEGLDFLVETLGLKSYTVPFLGPIDKSPQTVVYLCRFMDGPFYLTNNSITVFSEMKCVELHLFSDDIRKYGIIKTLEARQNILKNS